MPIRRPSVATAFARRGHEVAGEVQTRLLRGGSYRLLFIGAMSLPFLCGYSSGEPKRSTCLLVPNKPSTPIVVVTSLP